MEGEEGHGGGGGGGGAGVKEGGRVGKENTPNTSQRQHV